MNEEELEKWANEAKVELERKTSPKGALGLPTLLDIRRFEYGIPDGAFSRQASFDWVFVWQIPEEFNSGETYGGGLIVMPEEVRRRKKEMAPRGIVVSAGLSALDTLHSNGMALGDIVNFAAIAPYRIAVDVIHGQEFHLIVLTDSQIMGSEDTVKRIRSGEMAVHGPDDNGSHKISCGGKFRARVDPASGEVVQ